MGQGGPTLSLQGSGAALAPSRAVGFTSVLALGAALCLTTNIATAQQRWQRAERGKITQNQHETNPDGFVRLAWAARRREKGKASRKWMRACERVILDSLKNPSPFIRECLRQRCSGLGCWGALLAPGTGCAGRAGASLPAALPALPPPLPALTCSGHLGTAWSLGTALLSPQAFTGLSHRMVWGGGDLTDHLIPTPLPLTGTSSPGQLAQLSSQPGLEGL